LDRLEEFETTLEIRDVVVLGAENTDGGESGSRAAGSRDTRLDEGPSLDDASLDETSFNDDPRLDDDNGLEEEGSDVTDPRWGRSSR
ncbi:MAG: hypothetical protein V5A24_07565, partial [Haloarculaceae archaeon]